jgi:hypothetical protein
MKFIHHLCTQVVTLCQPLCCSFTCSHVSLPSLVTPFTNRRAGFSFFSWKGCINYVPSSVQYDLEAAEQTPLYNRSERIWHKAATSHWVVCLFRQGQTVTQAEYTEVWGYVKLCIEKEAWTFGPSIVTVCQPTKCCQAVYSIRNPIIHQIWLPSSNLFMLWQCLVAVMLHCMYVGLIHLCSANILFWLDRIIDSDSLQVKY